MDDGDIQGLRPAFTQPPVNSEDEDTLADFSQFYRAFFQTLVAFLMWQGARLPDAADIAQDTMIKACQRWSEIHQPKAWARKVASRALVRRIASIEEDLVEHLPEHSALLLPLTNVIAWEQRHDVLRLLDVLPPRQRQVLAWSLQGYTPTQIAEELKITSDAVRASLKKARTTLAQHLHTMGMGNE